MKPTGVRVSGLLVTVIRWLCRRKWLPDVQNRLALDGSDSSKSVSGLWNNSNGGLETPFIAQHASGNIDQWVFGYRFIAKITTVFPL